MTNTIPQPSAALRMPDRTVGQLVRQAALLLLVAFSSMVLVSFVVWKTATPHWITGGYPSFIGYGKNVEHLALKLSLLAAVCIGLAMPRFAKARWSFLLVAAMAGMLAWQMIVPEKSWALAVVLLVNLSYFSWWYVRDESQPTGQGAREPWPRFLSWGLVAVALVVAFSQFMVPVAIDLFHEGEVILCAHDWLAGGKPYETMFWPHGMGDSWLPAQFMRATGNEGLGIFILSSCTWALCGIFSIYLIAWNLIRRHGDAAVITLMISAVVPVVAYPLGWGIFGILALHLLANYTHRGITFAAGALLAWSFLWRMDLGTYASLAAIGFLFFDEYYTRGYQAGQTFFGALFDTTRLRNAAVRLAWLAGGIAAMFTLTRLTIGLPTFVMLNMALIELPQYHPDNTGYPLPLPLRLLNGVTIEPLLIIRWLTAHFLLFCTALAMFLAVKSRERRLGTNTPQARFLLMALLFGLLHLKSAIDRSDYGHVIFALAPLTMIVCIDLIGWLCGKVRWPSVRMAAVAGLSLVFFAVLLGAFARDFRGGPLVSQFTLVTHRLKTFEVSLNALKTCLSPTVKWEDLLEPTGDPSMHRVAAGVRQLRPLLDGHGVGEKQFLVIHSAPMLYPLLDRKSPTKYYLPGWAMNDAMQQDAVRDLQACNLQAVLKSNGWAGALVYYDCPDEHRMPIIHRQVEQTLQDCLVYATEIGDLHVRCPDSLAGYRLHCQPGQEAYLETPTGRLPLVPDGEMGNIDAYQDADSMLRIRGWAADRFSGKHTEKLLLFYGEKCISPLVAFTIRSDVVSFFGKQELGDTGIDVHVPKSLLESCDPAKLHVVAIAAGRASVLTVEGTSVAQRQGRGHSVR